jgi:hypothetical protein
MSLRLTGNRLGQVLIPSAVGLLAAGVGSAGVLWATAGALALPGPPPPVARRRRPLTLTPRSGATTASVNSSVEADRRGHGADAVAHGRPDAASTRTAASAARSSPCRVLSQSSSIPDDRIIAIGLASPIPAMSGAEPCEACAMQRSSEALIDGAMPGSGQLTGQVGEDVAEHVLGDDDVEGRARRSRCTVIASMWKSSTATSGSLGDLEADALEQPGAQLQHVALCTIVSRFAPAPGQLERGPGDPLHGGRVKTPIAMATSAVGHVLAVPAWVFRSA